MKKYWNRLVNFEWQGDDSLRMKAVKALAGFLALMLVFTILSRTADSMTVARVTTGTPEKLMLEREITAEGAFAENRQIIIATAEELLISHVNVAEGDYVEEGDILLKTDPDDLADKIAVKELEVSALASAIETEAYNSSLAASQQSKELSRMQEDYNTTRADQDKQVSRAKAAMDNAKTELDNYKNSKKELISKATADASGDDEAMEADGMTETEYNAMLKEYEQAYQDATDQYEDAKDARDQALKDAQRSIDDAQQTEKTDDSGLLQQEAELETAEKELNALKQLAEENGILRAPQDGFITSVTAAIGGQTSAMDFLMADTSEGFKFETTITSAEKKYLSTGDTVSLVLSNDTTITDLKVGSITEDEEEEGLWHVNITVKAYDGITIGQTATMQVELTSQTYSACVPNSVIQGDGSQAYIYVVAEEEGIIGTQQYVQKYEVKILDQNSTYTALDIYDANLEYIASTNKEVAEGDRIQVEASAAE